jgi:hypothetical protein
LRMMARTSGEFAIAHASQFPAQSLLGATGRDRRYANGQRRK